MLSKADNPALVSFNRDSMNYNYFYFYKIIKTTKILQSTNYCYVFLSEIYLMLYDEFKMIEKTAVGAFFPSFFTSTAAAPSEFH